MPRSVACLRDHGGQSGKPVGGLPSGMSQHNHCFVRSGMRPSLPHWMAAQPSKTLCVWFDLFSYQPIVRNPCFYVYHGDHTAMRGLGVDEIPDLLKHCRRLGPSLPVLPLRGSLGLLLKRRSASHSAFRADNTSEGCVSVHDQSVGS